LSAPRFAVPKTTPEAYLQTRVLRGELAHWPLDAGPEFEDRFLEACAAGGVAPLLQHRLRSSPASRGWPSSVNAALERAARMQAARDVLQEDELRAVLAAFADASIDVLLLKGAALAHSHYPEPSLRTRCDADVLIRTGDRTIATKILVRLGYRRRNQVSGTLVSYQECFSKQEGPLHQVIDLHWQISNGQVFARALTFDEALARSVPVPNLGPSVLTLCPAHALLLACMHRAAHLGADGADGSRLLWLYDIHLLAGSMGADEWQQFAELCVARAMRRITLDAFGCAHEALGTVFPADVIQRMGGATPVEISSAYLTAGRAGLLMTDLRALETWRERATLVREICFPPLDYVLAKYRARHRWQLPLLYLRRAVGACWKVVRS
jgi:hypothetical protein